jgi:hypothetical protein
VASGISTAQRQLLAEFVAVADSRQTLLCAYLSAVLLIGLVLNSLFRWAWADPIAGLVIAGIAVKEGIDAWKGDTCCVPISATATASPDGCDCCD